MKAEVLPGGQTMDESLCLLHLHTLQNLPESFKLCLMPKTHSFFHVCGAKLYTGPLITLPCRCLTPLTDHLQYPGVFLKLV